MPCDGSKTYFIKMQMIMHIYFLFLLDHGFYLFYSDEFSINLRAGLGDGVREAGQRNKFNYYSLTDAAVFVSLMHSLLL